LVGCPVGTDGDADEACEQDCPQPASSAGIDAVGELIVCRTVGAGSSCGACGSLSDHGDANAILNQDCPSSTETNPCYVCEDEHCCEVYAAYGASPEAVAHKECVQSCWNSGGSYCAELCYEQHPEGFQQWAERWACILTYCNDADACGDQPLPPCDVCANEHCAETFVELYTNAAGYLLFNCLIELPLCDQACIEACSARFPSAATLFENYAACQANHCEVECG
jgi:hypothetical protein